MHPTFVSTLLALTSASVVVNLSPFELQQEKGLPARPRPNPRPLPPLLRGICFDLDDPGELFVIGGSTDCPFDSDVMKFWRWTSECKCESVYKEICLDEEL